MALETVRKLVDLSANATSTEELLALNVKATDGLQMSGQTGRYRHR
jgi:hypothetical protein